MVSKKDRDDYEEGLRDSHGSLLDQFIWDTSGNHPGTDAYFKGRRGEQLDGDKNEDEDD